MLPTKLKRMIQDLGYPLIHSVFPHGACFNFSSRGLAKNLLCNMQATGYFMWINQGNGGRNEQLPFMNSLTSCMNKAVSNGYKECFKLTARGLYAISQSRYYRPEQVQLRETRRFEVQHKSGERATIYLIETSDGLKGTLVDGYGALSDPGISSFMSEVEDIGRKVARHNQHEC